MAEQQSHVQEDPTHRQHHHHHFPYKRTQQGLTSRYRPNAPKREHCICITIFILLLGIIILILWLAYHPSKPRFSVTSAAIYGLNATTPPLMSIAMQFTILITNPNKRVSIYFDRLSALVSYRNQPITPHVMLPPLYLEKHSTVSLSPEIGGTPVPVSEEVSNGLVMDEMNGVVALKLVFLGRLKWESGDIKSAHYGLYVKCDLLVGLRKDFVGQVPLLGAPLCDADT
ncbi:NDR1/HIN1-like protein 12 [Gastrolobium bilobum]|uniref:NDR1/HIN1-like protein 12 n=1 Tax=Gastrolobium bilobum TaxID=150636 RepID=UPI002AB18162|nr:NDR1/HIN1-like protein 12 [Gastrolobium bilobum]